MSAFRQLYALLAITALLLSVVPARAQFGLDVPAAAPLPPLPVGSVAPPIVTPTINGHGKIDLRALHGRVVLIDYWATWCGPCQAATPTLQYLHKTYAKQGLTVLGMNVDDPQTWSNVRPFMKHFGMTYPVAVLSQANVQSVMAYHADGLPSQYLLDKKGRVRWSQAGYSPSEGPMLTALIRRLLAEKG